jgi:outer membrane protein TolC
VGAGVRARGLIVLVLVAAGCSRSFYRRQADREVYHAIQERNGDPRWSLPRIRIDTPPPSRLFDPFNPDHPPMPPDDPAADRYMRCVYGMHGSLLWHRDGDAPWIEDPGWRKFVGVNDKGELELTPDRAIEIGVLNSREYQTALEQVYLNALALTLNRYEFVLHYFATNDTTFLHFGSGADESNTLTVNSTIGFQRFLAAGGQLMAEFANSFVFEFAGPDHTIATSNIIVNFTQPLLRGFGRAVRLEALTEAERSLLYAVRDFARFRKLFSFNVATQGYLQLLLQVQLIRNQEQNLKSQEQNLRLNEALLATGTISSVELDLAFQNYQQARLAVQNGQTALATSLDSFKIQLGLPPTLPVKIDESALAPFQLTDPALDTLQDEIEKTLAHYREMEQAPPLADLQDGFGRLKDYQRRTMAFIESVREEIKRWEALPEEGDDPQRLARRRAAQRALAQQLPELGGDLVTLRRDIERGAAGLRADRRRESWELLQRLFRQQGALTAQVGIIQTQVRVYLIRLRPVRVEEEPALAYAFANRLDLMNIRGRVVDAWRQIRVTANALLGVATVNFNANIATKPGGSNPFDFRSSASSYSLGVHLEAPLNRQAERNAYRASQIAYEHSRRDFMAAEDNIAQSVRRDLRLLNTERLNFEIIRQQLISAARAVEAARDRLLIVENAADTTATQNVLTALGNLLNAKQQLITSWVSYETDRIQLLLDMEALQVDARGLYVDEYSSQTDQPARDGGGGEDLPLPTPLPGGAPR